MVRASCTSRLTPPDIADFSPAVSPSGEWTAAASPGAARWGGEVEDLATNVYVWPQGAPAEDCVSSLELITTNEI
jgi:hypothetical protein